jgi:hypothetical protein
MINTMTRALKYGLVILGMGLLCIVVQFVVYGGMGPCALPGQLEILLLGIAFTGIGGSISLVSLPVVLVKKYRARTTSDFSLFAQGDRDS